MDAAEAALLPMDRRRAARLVVGDDELTRLVDSAMDAIVELDDALRVTRVNPAAAKLFAGAAGTDFRRFLSRESGAQLGALVEELGARAEGERSLWIPGALAARQASGAEFPAEATLSRFDVHRRVFYTLILRNVNDRLEAERRIEALTGEAQYLREELAALGGFDELLGGSEALREVLHAVRQVAATDASVLISGETGTGKELVARAIHAASGRRSRPLIKVNCAAIPATLVESEIFGHERGSFTGATGRRPGCFELADGGTLFLDEIAEMSPATQVKFLRVLQDGRFRRVGGQSEIAVDVRVIAATNKSPAKALQDGALREDLYYRIAVFTLTLPPLRERTEDLNELVRVLLEEIDERHGRAVRGVDEGALAVLRRYAWPGNVRELRNVLERAVIVCPGDLIGLAHLPSPPAPAAVAAEPAADEGAEDVRLRVGTTVDEGERRLILRTLAYTGNNKTRAAEILGISLKTLHNKLNRYNRSP